MYRLRGLLCQECHRDEVKMSVIQVHVQYTNELKVGDLGH